MGENRSAENFAGRLENIRDDANSALVKAAATMKRFYDRHRQEACEYQPGDRVWLEATHIHSARPTEKLDDWRFGPFKVLARIGQRACRLQLPTSESWRLHPVSHTSLLRPYHPPVSPLQAPAGPPPPIRVGDHVDQEVEGA